MKTYDYIVVGAGFYGAVVAERLASQKDASVLVLEKRDHIGGNCYSHVDEQTGIEYHKYGTHIFHTNSRKVWDYLANFTEFNNYHHQVLTTYQNRVYQMPINLETINSFYSENLRPYEVSDFLERERLKEPIVKPRNFEEKAISQIGRPLYEAFIKGYTMKQWGCDPKELPASILNRLPIRSNYNEAYFKNARYEGIPLEGYTKIFERMLAHSNIDVQLGVDYLEQRDVFEKAFRKKLIFTGPLDAFFEYQLGRLQWRSVRFTRETPQYSDYQGTSVMNYADPEIEYTRIHEPMHLHPERDLQNSQSLIFYEYSLRDDDNPYYPIGNKRNQDLLSEYRSLAGQRKDVHFGGRLGAYVYYDMDTVVASALNTAQSL